MHRRLTAGVLAVLALAACAKTETPEQAAARLAAETDAARPAIQAGLDRYVQHYNAGLVDSLVAMHAADAHVMPPNSPAQHGSDEIRAGFAANFQQVSGGVLALRSENIAVSGPMAVDRGRWAFTPPAGAPIPADSGKYVTHYRKHDAQWMIAEVIWNSDNPAAPPPPPARR